MTQPLKVAIIGAGMGGLTAAATLARAGIDVDVYEQATQFTRIGSGIQMSPNAMKVLRAIGLEEQTREIAFRPRHQLSRDWDTGHVNLDYPFGDVIEKRYALGDVELQSGGHDALYRSVADERGLSSLDRAQRVGKEMFGRVLDPGIWIVGRLFRARVGHRQLRP